MKLDYRKEFLEEFQKKIIQGRRLLQTSNHRWADRLFTDTLFDIERAEWLDIQKKHQLIMIISNSWWIYINSLIQNSNESGELDIIKYIDAYKRFFSFLSKLDDFYLFNNFATSLLKSFISLDDLSQRGITKFVNSFCVKLREREEYIKIIELQIVLTFLRKSVIPQEFFHFAMELLGRTLFKLELGKRALFLYVFLENVNTDYDLMENSSEFVKSINNILIHRVPGYLKEEFSNVFKININENNINEILIELEKLILYLNNVGEYPWIIPIIKNLFYKIQKYQSYGDAVTYIRRFVEFAISRNRFEMAFNIYDFLEDLFMLQTDLGYDNIIIELWVAACKKFVDMKEKKYLLQSLEKLNIHLKTPQNSAQLFHYFHTCNYIWQFKSMFFSLEQKDFWKMMFYRALYEEKDFPLATKILSYVDKNLRTIISDPLLLFNETSNLRDDVYSFGKDQAIELHEGFVISQIVIRINRNGLISFRMMSKDGNIIEGKITDEYWNDVHILDIFYDIFSENQTKKFDFSLKEFGKLIYIFLPKEIRNLFKQFEIKSLDLIPEIYFILDNMTIPFELIYDNNFFLLKYSIGYIIGEPWEIRFGHDFEKNIEDHHEGYNVLVIDCINSLGPIKWNESAKSKELIFPFLQGVNEFNYITEFFNEREEVKQITVLSSDYSSRDYILSQLRDNSNHIVHFVGNIFYSKWNPYDSFFLTNNNDIVTFREINDYIKLNTTGIKPFLFFNSQIYDVEGKKLKNVIRVFGEIVENFNYEKITGLISRVFPIFDDETKEIIANFYINLFNNQSQGISLLKARQACMANKMTKIVEEKIMDLKDENGLVGIDLQSSLALSSYMLFGKPWKKLI